MSKNPRSTLILSSDELEKWVASYENTGKLPKLYIPCVQCNTGIVAGHDNLRKKVKKYQGIRNLLTSFVCRDCRSSTSESVEKPVVQKSKSKIEAPKKKERTIYDLPKVNLNAARVSYSIDDLVNNQDVAKEFTSGVCIRPQLFLNNDRCCDDCVLYANCACNVKTLSKAFRKQLEQSK